MVNTYVTPFIQKYGLRDGLILSELCGQEFNSWKKGLGFSKKDCESVLSFMTGKQIRSALHGLLKSGCIERLAANNSFDQTAKYRINPDVYNNYMKSIIENNKGN
jgi:hypothetical protein